VIVNEVNDPPVLPVQADCTIDELTTLTVANGATDPDLPPSWTPTQAQVGTYPLTIRVTDNGVPPLTATTTFQLAVTGQDARLNVQRLASGEMQLSINGDVGYDFEVQKSADLVNWDKLLEFQLSNSPASCIDPDTAGGLCRFYRLRLMR
jgi:hypothetical protein